MRGCCVMFAIVPRCWTKINGHCTFGDAVRSVCCSWNWKCVPPKTTEENTREASEKPKNIIIMNIGLVSTLIPEWDKFFCSFFRSYHCERSEQTEQNSLCPSIPSKAWERWGEFRLVRVPRGSMRLWLFDIFSFPNKYKSIRIALCAFSVFRWQPTTESMRPSNNDFYRR